MAAPRKQSAFTLVEMIVVMGVMLLMISLIGPAMTSIQGGNDVTSATYDISGAIQNARAYAMGNNTYTWIGFFEDSTLGTSQGGVATAGTGRVVMYTVASRDGTSTDDLTNSKYPGMNDMAVNDATEQAKLLIPVGKIQKISNVHMLDQKNANFQDPQTQVGPPGTPANSFKYRPAVGGAAYKIDPANAQTTYTFTYPLGTAQNGVKTYKFGTLLQFNPRGECQFNVSGSLHPLVEIGLEPTHGAAISPTTQDFVAIQVSGVEGNVRVYRQ